MIYKDNNLPFDSYHINPVDFSASRG